MLRKTIIALIAIASFSAKAAVSLNISNGILMGANNVDVKGTLYNVAFTDDDTEVMAKMPISQSFDAAVASQALLDQVLIGKYDDLTHLTNGCSFDGFCYIMTLAYVEPTSYYNLVFVSALNFGGYYSGSPDMLQSGTGHGSNAAGAAEHGEWFTNAVWTVAAVPEPSSLAMLMTGFLAMFGIARKRNS